MANPVIVLVGHCGPDAYSLKNAIGRIVPGAEIIFAHDTKALAEHLPRAELLLVNRALEAGFGTPSGLELIGSLRQASGEAAPGGRPKYMLISNFPEAQAAAVAAGALPGFGKVEMYSEETGRKLRAALGQMAER